MSKSEIAKSLPTAAPATSCTIPTDPTDSYYLSNCFVCKEVTSSGEKIVFGYGGFVCASCRAFFRRANQKTKEPEFNCKNENLCKITVETRRRCQKCRYQQCLNAGLNPDAVLTEEEKKQRFRKMIEKRKSEKVTRKIKPRKPKAFQNKAPEVKYTSDSEDNSTDSGNNVSQSLMMEIETLKETYELIKHQNQHQCGQTFLSDPRSNFISYLSMKAKQFKQFAYQQISFASLSKKDQDELIMKNTPLYIQLCIAFHFSSTEGKAEMEKILFDSEQQLSQGPMENFNLESFNTLTRFLKADANLFYYDSLIRNLKSITSRQSRHEPILAHIILFNNDTKLTDCTEPTSHEGATAMSDSMFESFIKKGSNGFDMQDFISTLDKMASFCSINLAPGNFNNSSLVNSNLVMSYTREEECWLQNQYRLLEDAFRSVTVGDELIQEFMMFSLDVPPSKKFMARVTNIFLERVLRLFEIHSDYNELSLQQKHWLMKTNGPAVFALIMAKLENSPTGMHQLQESFGELDESEWKDHYLPVFSDSDKVKKMAFKDSLQFGPNPFSDKDLEQHRFIITAMKAFTTNQEFYKLQLLFVVTSTWTNSTLSKHHNTYSEIIRRRSAAMNQGQILERFNNTLVMLNRLYELLFPYMTNGQTDTSTNV